MADSDAKTGNNRWMVETQVPKELEGLRYEEIASRFPRVFLRRPVTKAGPEMRRGFRSWAIAAADAFLRGRIYEREGSGRLDKLLRFWITGHDEVVRLLQKRMTAKNLRQKPPRPLKPRQSNSLRRIMHGNPQDPRQKYSAFFQSFTAGIPKTARIGLHRKRR